MKPLRMQYLSDHCWCCDNRVDLDMIFDATLSMHGDDLSCGDLARCCYASILVLPVLRLLDALFNSIPTEKKNYVALSSQKSF